MSKFYLIGAALAIPLVAELGAQPVLDLPAGEPADAERGSLFAEGFDLPAAGAEDGFGDENWWRDMDEFDTRLREALGEMDDTEPAADPAPGDPEESARQARLIALGRQVVDGLALARAYDDYGREIGRSVVFCPLPGIFRADVALLGHAEAAPIAYITLISGRGEVRRVGGVSPLEGTGRSSIALQVEDGFLQPLPLHVAADGDSTKDVALTGFSEVQGVLLADAVVRRGFQAAGRDWIEITGARSPGESGSPVFDRQGRVTGVVVARFQGRSWINFAIPVAVGSPDAEIQVPEKWLVPQRAASLRPRSTDPRALAEVARALDERRHTRALAILNRMLERDPRQAAVWALQGLALKRAGDPDSAVTSLRMALAFDPGSASAWNALALAALKQEDGDPGEISAALAEAVAANPMRRESRWLAALDSLARGEYVTASSALLALSDEYPSSPALFYCLGLARAKSGDLEGAYAAALRSRTLDGRDPRCHHLLGMIYHKAGDLDQAAESLAMSTQIDPAQPQVWRLLSRVHLAAGRRSEARAAHREFLARSGR